MNHSKKLNLLIYLKKNCRRDIEPVRSNFIDSTSLYNVHIIKLILEKENLQHIVTRKVYLEATKYVPSLLIHKNTIKDEISTLSQKYKKSSRRSSIYARQKTQLQHYEVQIE